MSYIFSKDKCLLYGLLLFSWQSIYWLIKILCAMLNSHCPHILSLFLQGGSQSQLLKYKQSKKTNSVTARPYLLFIISLLCYPIQFALTFSCTSFGQSYLSGEVTQIFICKESELLVSMHTSGCGSVSWPFIAISRCGSTRRCPGNTQKFWMFCLLPQHRGVTL